MSDSSVVMNAVIAALGSDPTLLALMPNGVYEDVAPTFATKFVIVSHIVGNDVRTFQVRAFEDVLLLVEARAKVDTGNPSATGDVRAAAARIDALLDPQSASASISMAGYGLMGIVREEPVRGTERDDKDPAILWRRRGGRYRILAALT